MPTGRRWTLELGADEFSRRRASQIVEDTGGNGLRRLMPGSDAGSSMLFASRPLGGTQEAVTPRWPRGEAILNSDYRSHPGARKATLRGPSALSVAASLVESIS
jgi:hypothetical protein